MNYKLFMTRSLQPTDIDQMVLLLEDKFYLLKEERNSSYANPVRLCLSIREQDMSLFLNNRNVEVIPSGPETRKLLSTYGVMV